MSDEFETSAGAYVLGALAPDEREAFARHLRECAECRTAVDDLAGLPGLLSLVPERTVAALGDEDAPDADDVPPLPDVLLPRLLAEQRRLVRERRVRRLSAAVVAAVVAAGLALGGIAIGRSTATNGRPQVTASTAHLTMTSIAPESLSADVTVTPVAWGTRLDLVCRYDDQTRGDTAYSLVVVDRGGHAEQVGTWTAHSGQTARMSAGTSLARDDIAQVQVRAPSGLTVASTSATGDTYR